MSDNRFDCIEDCNLSCDDNNKCDGHCLHTVPNLEERLRRAREHNA